ncbi:MAG: hypothetical protein QM758_06995 [Armatimonas sp.]
MTLNRSREEHGFLWMENHLYDINSLLKSTKIVVCTATAINDSNFIVGSAMIPGKEIACLLVPEK